MFYFRLIVAIIWYIPKFFLSIMTTIATMILAPFIALPPFVVHREENATTGYPSQFPGMPRAFLVKWLRGFQTHDDCLDAFWYSGKYRYSWMKNYEQIDYDTRWWLRYCCYVAWLWRNPAYGFADMLGYNQVGMKELYTKDNDFLWKTGIPNTSFWVVVNSRGVYGFNFQAQYYYYKDWCIEIVLGYGLSREEPDDKCMINCRIIPWRRYPK